MKKRAVSLLVMTVVAAAPAGAALSDFIPNESLLLDPVPVDGLFEFNDIIIGEPVLLSVDRSVWGNQTVTLSAAGDITIHGALDAGNGPLALHSANHILLDGKIYGDSLPVEAGSFSWINNPNGSDDIHWTGGVLTTLIPDDPLSVESGSMDEWTSGVVVERVLLETVFILRTDVSVTTVTPGSLSNGFILTAGPTPVPLPPAVLLFGGALIALSARLRRSV